jgi:hypothetical protein
MPILEEFDMNRATRIIASLFLSVAFMAPAAILVAEPQTKVSVRVYDSKRKEYHNWDDNENHAWGAYLTTNHQKPHEFKKANKKEQTNYWNWRHDHPDGK